VRATDEDEAIKIYLQKGELPHQNIKALLLNKNYLLKA